MAATKYVPKNFFGGAPPTSLGDIYVPEPGEELVLTEIIATNTSDSTRTLSVAYRRDSTDVMLIGGVSMPARSVMNLNLYLPIDDTMRVKAGAASGVEVTVNGLLLEEV